MSLSFSPGDIWASKLEGKIRRERKRGMPGWMSAWIGELGRGLHPRTEMRWLRAEWARMAGGPGRAGVKGQVGDALGGSAARGTGRGAWWQKNEWLGPYRERRVKEAILKKTDCQRSSER